MPERRRYVEGVPKDRLGEGEFPVAKSSLMTRVGTSVRRDKNGTELSASQYDEQWSRLSDFVRHNPGARHRRRLIAEAVALLPEPVHSILDVGCGLGELIIELKRHHPTVRVTGLDISKVAIDACRAAFPEEIFHVANINEDALESSFDLIVCSEVTEHLAEPRHALANMRKMTRPGGFLILTTPHGRIHPTERAIGHIKHPKRSEIAAALREAGFSVVRVRQWGWPAYTIIKYAANMAPGATMELLGQGSYGKGTRYLNDLAYRLTHWLSLPTCGWGPQFVITARADH